MQVSALQIVNAANGATANATFSAVSRIGFTVSAFEEHYDMEGQEIPKMQSSGQWQNYEYVRRMMIHQEGKIIGASAADYNWQRRTLLLAALTDSGTQTTYYHATINVTPTGHPQIYAQCVLTDMGIGTGLDDMSAQPYFLQWRNDFGYWRLVSNDAVYKI